MLRDAGDDQDRLVVMVVDDERVNRMWAVGILKRMGHHVVEAGSGEEALATFSRLDVDIVLLDVLMPGIDGFETAVRLKQIEPDRWVPIVFLSGLNEQQTRSSWTDLGDDYLAKPVDPQLFTARMRSLARAIRQERVAVRAVEAMGEEQRLAQQLMGNMGALGRVQDYACIHTRSASLSISSGDCVVVEEGMYGRTYVLLADAMGHGLVAAVSLLPAVSVFRAMARKGFDPYLIAREINAKLRAVLPRGRFVSAAVLEVNPATRCVRGVNAGLPAIHLLDDAGRVRGELVSSLPPFGAVSTARLQGRSTTLEIDQHCRLFLCTDGFSEVFANEVDDWGFWLGLHSAACSAMHGANCLWQAWSNRTASDDATLVVVDLAGLLAGSAAVAAVAAVAAGQAVPAASGEPPSVRRPVAVSQHLASLSLGAPLLRDNPGVEALLASLSYLGLEHLQGEPRVALVLSELLANALEHGVLGLHSTLKDAPDDGMDRYYALRQERLQALTDGRIDIDIHALPDGQRLQIAVKDSGRGFEVVAQTAEASAAGGYSGRGIDLLRALCDDVQHHEQGTRTVVTLAMEAP